MEKLIKLLRSDYPELTFLIGTQLCWSPERQEIYYNPGGGKDSAFGVLHEIGHARLGHRIYKTDVDLLKKEVSAWEEALTLAKKYGIELKQEYIQNCLDTYREWIYRRSICPDCRSTGLQDLETRYRCLNCAAVWRVSASRFCRPYRSHNKSQA